MAIDPRISLMGIQPTFSLFDLGATMAQGQQLQAGRLAIGEEQRQQQEADAIRQAYRQQYGGSPPAPGLASIGPTVQAPHAGEAPFPPRAAQEAAASHQALGGGGPPTAPPAGMAQAAGGGLAGLGPQMGGGGSPPHGLAAAPQSPRDDPFVRSLYRISPQAGRTAEAHAYDTQAVQYTQHQQRAEFLARVADGILEANTQEAYTVGRAMLIQQGMPAAQMPEMYDKNYVRQLSGMGHDSASKLANAQARLADAKAQSERGKAPAYTGDPDLDAILYSKFGDQIAPGSRPTPTMMREARQELLASDPTRRLTSAKARREEEDLRTDQELRDLERRRRAQPGGAETAGRAMSEADVADAMQQTGKTRAEVVEAARNKGYSTPEDKPTPATTPATAPPTTPAPAPTTAPAGTKAPTAAPTAPPTTKAPAARATAPGRWAQAPERAEGTTAPAAAVPSAWRAAEEQKLERLEAKRAGQEQWVETIRPRATTPRGHATLAEAHKELARLDKHVEDQRAKLEGPEQEARKTTAREEAERQQRLGQTTAETLGKEAPNLYDVQSATPVNPATPYGEVLERQRLGTVRQLPQRQAERLQVTREAVPVLERMQRYVDVIYGPGGELASASRNDLQQLLNGTLPEGQMQRYFPTLVEAARFVESNASTLARGLKGEVGAMSEGDIERAMAGLPHFRSLFSLGLGFGGGYVPGRGIGPSITVKPQMRLADTERTARNVLQDTVDIVNRTTAQIVGQKDFQYPELQRARPVPGAPPGTPGPAGRREPGGAGAGW